MIKLKKYLNRPTYAVDRPWTLALLNATTIGLILAIFEPFHYRLNSIIQFGVLCVFIGLTFIASVLGFVVAPKLFKRFYDPEQWTIKKNIIHCFSFLLFMGVCTFIYDHYFLIKANFWDDLGTPEFYKILCIDMLAAFTIGAIPLIFGLFIVENNALKRNLLEAQKLNKALSERHKDEKGSNEMITLSGETKDSVTLLPQNIFYMEASGNYVDIYYKEEGKIDILPNFVIITNGTILTDRMLAFIKRNISAMTISIDGPKEINDIQRIYKNGKGSYERIAHFIHTIQEKTNVKIQYEATYTQLHIDHNYSHEDISKFMDQTFGIEGVVVNDQELSLQLL